MQENHLFSHRTYRYQNWPERHRKTKVTDSVFTKPCKVNTVTRSPESQTWQTKHCDSFICFRGMKFSGNFERIKMNRKQIGETLSQLFTKWIPDFCGRLLSSSQNFPCLIVLNNEHIISIGIWGLKQIAKVL